MKSYLIDQGEYFISQEMLTESIARRELEMSENRRIREAALRASPDEREHILEKNPELKISLEPQNIARDWANRFLGDVQATHPSMRQYIKIYGGYNKLDKIAILNAHGSVLKETGRSGNPKHIWAYQNGGKYYSIQGWINMLDGEFSALALFSCYKDHNFNLASKKSLLVIPDREIGVTELEGIPGMYHVKFSLHNPTLKRKDREIDSRTIETALQKLEKENRIKMLREAAEKGLQEIDY